MFFHISKIKQDNFPNHHQTKHFVINLDNGWTHVQDHLGNDIWYKGYLDDAPLRWFAVRISEETVPTYSGNFCVIKVTDQGLKINTDKLRSFPIWYDYERGLTNLKDIGAIQWSDDLTAINNDWVLLNSKFDAVGVIDDSLLSLPEVIDAVDDILTRKTKEFLSQLTSPIRVFLSGGMDTTLLFSYVEKYADQFELIRCNHFDHDYFFLKNNQDLLKFQYYNQIHHWNENCVLVSGAPGDEFTCRNPVTVDQLLRFHGSSFVETFHDPRFKHSHNYSFLLRDYIEDLTEKPKYPNGDTLEKVIRDCANYNVNDWQHWHLGNTLTWAPLRDIEIFKLFARLRLPDLQSQIMCSSAQVELIRRNNPDLLKIISDQKNTHNYMSNLANYFKDL